MLERSVTESDDRACSLERDKGEDGARHQTTELYLAPNGEMVPGTIPTSQSTKKPPGPLYKRSRGF